MFIILPSPEPAACDGGCGGEADWHVLIAEVGAARLCVAEIAEFLARCKAAGLAEARAGVRWREIKPDQ
jgi:hypothetical protein